MSFLSFIKERQAQRSQTEQQSQTQKTVPEHQAQQTVPKDAVSQLSPDQKLRLDAVKSDMQKAMAGTGQEGAPVSPAAGDATERPEAHRQKMSGQDKAAPALSPTTAQSGITLSEKDASAPSQTSPSTEQHRSGRQQTIARTSPSWER